MSLLVKDGNGSLTALKTTLSASEHLPHHIVQSVVNTVGVSGSVNVNNTVGVSGSVNVNNTVGVSGTVNVNIANIGIDGGTGVSALVTKVTASIDDPVYISASLARPVYVTSDVNKPVHVYTTPGVPVYVSSSEGNFVQVTASSNAPVFVTSNNDKPVFVVNDTAHVLYVSSSDAFPVVTKQKSATNTARYNFSSFAGTIDWAGTSQSDISGTFILAPSSTTRAGLMFTNKTDKDLYVALGDTDFASTNGFLLITTSSAPESYSFILYSSGTYFAEPSFVGVKHSGFFISSSNIDVAITSFLSE